MKSAVTYFGMPRYIFFFSANTMTGKSACSHPAQPAWEGFWEGNLFFSG